MSELKLRADANAFVPSFMSPVAAAPKTPDDSFDRMAKDIESKIVDEEVGELSAVMNDTGIGSNNTSQTSGLPAHLSKHAAEFWFPESRDCQCCKGFKYGCQCVPSNNNVCSCSSK